MNGENLLRGQLRELARMYPGIIGVSLLFQRGLPKDIPIGSHFCEVRELPSYQMDRIR